MGEEKKQLSINEELLIKLHEKLDKMAVAIERTNIAEYVEMAKKPWRFITFSFIGGVARGFGLAIGMTLIAAIVIIVISKILSHLITFPIVGQQIAELVKLVNQYLREGSKLNIQ